MSAAEVIAQFEEDARLHPPGIVSRHTQRNGEAVHGIEGRIQTLVHQEIRVVIEKLHRLFAVELVGPDSQLRGKLVQGEKFHDLAHARLTAELRAEIAGFLQGDARHQCQLLRVPLQDQQGLVPEIFHDPGRHHGADALDGPAAQIALDLQGRLGQHPLEKFRLELLAEIGVAGPLARDHQPLAQNRHGDGAHHGDGISAAAVQPQDRVAVVIILINHSGDRAL